jgi:hypothetical protein
MMLSIKAFVNSVLIAILLMVPCHYGFADSTQSSPASLTSRPCATSVTAVAFPAGNCNQSSWCLSQTSAVLTAMNSIVDPNGGSLCPGTYFAYFLGCSVYSGSSCGGGNCGHSMNVYATNRQTGNNTQVSSMAFWQGNAEISPANENPGQTIAYNIIAYTFSFATAQYDNFYFYTYQESDGFMQFCMMSVYQTSPAAT